MAGLGYYVRNIYPRYKASGFARSFKRARYLKIMQALGLSAPASIVDIGCGTAADFSRFAVEDGFNVHGVDIERQPHHGEIQFTQADACKLPFPDRHFDAAVSIGLFEHIQPIERLCEAAQEIARVASRYCVVVPSIGTLLEPHTLIPMWGLRDRNRKWKPDYALNFLSDEAWLQFSGFDRASSRRFWYLPGIQNLMIHGPAS